MVDTDDRIGRQANLGRPACLSEWERTSVNGGADGRLVAGSERLRLAEDVQSLPTAEAVTIRESCTSLQELQRVQEQVSRDFGSSEGVSSDIDLLRGHVIVFTDDPRICRSDSSRPCRHDTGGQPYQARPRPARRRAPDDRGEPRLRGRHTRRTKGSWLDPALHRFVEELVRLPRARHVRLSRLGRRDVEEQLLDLLESSPPKHLLDRVIQLSDGVPFLTEELVAGGITADGPVPAFVADLMVTRTSALSEPAQLVIQAAAIGGVQVRHQLLSRVLDVDAGGAGYRFHHALMRQAVDASTLPGERLRWHRRWAEVLDADVSTHHLSWARIAGAHHWAGADDQERAFETALEAAQWAHVAGAESERGALLTRAFSTCGTASTTPQTEPVASATTSWRRCCWL